MSTSVASASMHPHSPCHACMLSPYSSVCTPPVHIKQLGIDKGSEVHGPGAECKEQRVKHGVCSKIKLGTLHHGSILVQDILCAVVWVRHQYGAGTHGQKRRGGAEGGVLQRCSR